MTEKPQNGVQGLKHWRYDLVAGMQVALVSLPLSLGIAVASGAPPVTGIISAIIAGLIFPFLGGAYVTISGPAAGLAPALLAGMLTLGHGDLAAGYPLLLVAICLTGLAQVLLSMVKAGKLVAMFLPVTVVEAMLAAIGLMIIIKQIPALLGDLVPPAKNMMAAISSVPGHFLHLDLEIFVIGALCLFLMFYLNRTRHAWMRRVPPPLFVAAVGVVLGYAFDLDTKYLIKMPEDILEGGITLPAFGEVWNRTELWGSVLVVVITLTLIDGIESLATISAVDKIDPYQRKSQPNTTLRAMGISNMLSSIAGGLTIIPGGVKSRANIDAGGRTLWANFYNAVFLILFLFFAKDLISRIPLAAISAILIYVGWRLCEYKVFTKTFAIGRDQIVIFVFTILAILATDLLKGILLGVAAEIVMLVYLLTPSFRFILAGRLTFHQASVFLRASLLSLFRSPVIKIKQKEEDGRAHYHVSLSSLVCFNLLSLERTLSAIPANAGLTLTVTESGRIIDHTSMEYLHQLKEEYLRDGRPFAIRGMENFQQFTSHSLSARMHDVKLVKEKAALSLREKEMADAAGRFGFQFSPATVGTLNVHNLIYLRRGSNRQESNVMTGSHDGCDVRIFDYSHTSAPDYYAEYRHTLTLLRPAGGGALPDLAVAPGDYLDRYLVEYQEVEIAQPKEFARHYKLYAADPERARAFITGEIVKHLCEYPGFYLEIRNNAVLVFRPERDLEPASEIPHLLSFAASVSRALR